MMRRSIDLLRRDLPGRSSIVTENQFAQPRLEIRVDTRTAGIRGWYRIKIIGACSRIQHLSLEVTGADGVLYDSLRWLAVPPAGFRAYVYLGQAVREFTLKLDFEGDQPDSVSATMRPLGHLELLWQTLRRGVIDRCSVSVAHLLRPPEHFILTTKFPFPAKQVERYQRWIDSTEPGAVRAAIANLRVVAPERPRISVLLAVCDPPPRFLIEAIESLRRQTTENWQLCIADDSSTDSEVRQMLGDLARDANVKVTFGDRRRGVSAATNNAFSLADAPFVARLEPRDSLAPEAIEVCSGVLANAPATTLLYTDHDEVDRQGRRSMPCFKPEFSRDLLYSYNYLHQLTVHRADTIRQIGGWRSEFDGAHDYDVVLRSLEIVDPKLIRHVPLVLYHVESTAGVGTRNHDAGGANCPSEAGRRALAEHFARSNVRADVSVVSGIGYRIRYALPDPPPRVSIIIPLRDRPDLLTRCVASLRERTRYPDFEILLLDNGSEKPATRALLESYRGLENMRIVRSPGPFNYAALNNHGVAEVTGEYVCFLNNDTAAISSEWLSDMVGYASQDGVGCVGAKLLYENDTVQHAGVVIGLGGVAGHVFRNQGRNAAGYGGRLRIASNYSALTGACLLIRRAIFEEVGGFDESELPVSFNDIDLCLRIRDKGYRNIFTPFAELYHLESATRGFDTKPENKERARREYLVMRKRYEAELKWDPCYSPHLTRLRDDFSVVIKDDEIE